MKWYMGYRTLEGDAIVCQRGEAGPIRPFLPDLSLQLRNHSPDGFEWGYGGSGPAQLALALVLDATGDPDLALALYQDFKWAFVARWPRDTFDITAERIRSWCEKRIETNPGARERVEQCRWWSAQDRANGIDAQAGEEMGGES